MTRLFLLMTVFFSTFLFARDIAVEVRRRDIDDKNYWLIRGTTPLPEGTVLAVRIWFEGVEVANSRARIKSKHNRFDYYYRIPAEKVLAGRYTLEVVYRKNLQNRVFRSKYNLQDFEAMVEFYWPENALREERQKRREYAIFFASAIPKTTALLEQAGQQQQKFLQVDKASLVKKRVEVRNWTQKLFAHHQKLKQQYDTMRHPYVLAPYSLQSINDFAIILRYTYDILYQYVYQVSAHYGLASSKEKAPTTDVANHLREIDRMAKQILAREPIPGNMTHKELQQDLDWIQYLYTTLLKQRQNHQNNPNMWSQVTDQLQKDIATMKTHLQNYRDSSLLKSNPALLSNWAKLLGQLSQLATSLGQDDEQKTKKHQNMLAATYATIYKIVLDARRQKQDKKKELHDKIENALALAKKLDQNLQDKLNFVRQLREDLQKNSEISIPDSIKQWQQQWQQDLQKLQQATKAIQEYDSASYFHSKLQYMNFCLLQIFQTYQNILGGKISSADIPKIYHFRRVLNVNLQHLNNKLRES